MLAGIDFTIAAVIIGLAILEASVGLFNSQGILLASAGSAGNTLMLDARLQGAAYLSNSLGVDGVESMLLGIGNYGVNGECLQNGNTLMERIIVGQGRPYCLQVYR